MAATNGGMVKLHGKDELFLGHPVSVAGFRQLPGEDVWLGTIYLFGTAHHFEAIRVKRDASGNQVASRDPHNRLEDVHRLNDAACETTRIPGLEGEFVVTIFPHGR